MTIELPSPVNSVNGKTGDVFLDSTDISDLSTLLNAKVDVAGDTMTGTLTAPKLNITQTSDVVGEVIKLSAAQTSNSFEIRNSSNTLLSSFDSSGRLKSSQGMYVKNAFYAVLGQANADLSMIGMYDRNELAIADKRGTITVTITGAGSASTNYESLFDGSGNFYSITATDSSTTKIQINIDLGSNVANYSSGFWQPFVHYRLNTGGTTGSFTGTWYKKITVEVSLDNITWYKPSSGAWETTSAGDTEQNFGVGGLWMGTNGNPSIPGSTWRYIRFILEDRQENSGYASKASVWLAEIGMRHYSAPFTRIYLPSVGGTLYGNLIMSDASNFVFNTATGTKFGTSASQKLSFYNATPVVQQTELTDELTTITHTAPVTPDYAIQPLTAGGFGFVTADEGHSVLSVIANLQTRVNELETKLVAYGLLPDAD